MKRITYNQLWVTEQLAQETDLDNLVVKVFKQPEVIWLLDQGFSHRFYNDREYAQDVVEFTLEFTVPEEIVTYICMRWPRSRQIVDYKHI